jgi:hypothetical protein
VTVATIADRILKETGYEFSVVDSTEVTALTIVEYLIDDAIDYINAECGTAIADLTGAAGSKSLVGEEDEVAAVKLLSKLYLKARQEKGESVSIGSLSASTSSSDSYLKVYGERLDKLLMNLKELDADYG